MEVHGEVNGKNWEPVEDLYPPGPVRDPYEEVFPEDPAPKPKASRKGRK